MRHLNNSKSIDAQVREIKALEAKVAQLKYETEQFMLSKGITRLEGNDCHVTMSEISASTVFDTTAFKKDKAYTSFFNKYNKTKKGYNSFKYIDSFVTNNK